MLGKSPAQQKRNERTQLMAKKKVAKKLNIKARTKSEIYRELSERTELSRKQVVAVFEEMSSMIKKDLGKRGPGVFTVPGLMKVKVVRKPATKARKGINPFTQEEMMFKAKPARNVVKATPLKAMKDMV
ncbi:MAG: DNA-binding protein [Planctomycetes bacterium]|nr:DNA-binding protein [Planctomycetota bacterium]